MNKSVGTIIVLIMAIGLGVYVLKFNNAPDEEKSTEQEILSLANESVEAIGILQKDKEDIVILKTKDNNWKVLSHKADINVVNSLLSALNPLKALRGFTPKVSNLEDFGLAEPESRIDIKTDSGQYGILVGEGNIDGTAYFVKLAGNEEIFTVQSSIISMFLKEANDFRDRKILDFDAAQVNYVHLYDDQTVLEAEKNTGDEWVLLQPVKDRANEGTIQAIINSLSSLKAKKFVTDDLVDLGEYGINPDSPLKYAELGFGEGENRIKLLIGARNKDSGDVYVKNIIGYTIYEVSPGINDNFSKPGLELRFSYPLNFDPEAVKNIQIKTGDKDIKCSKVNETEWEMTSPREADCSEIVPRLLSKMRYSTVNDYADTGMMPEPMAVISLFPEGSVSPLKLTVEDKQADGTLYVTSSQRNVFMNIDGSLADVIRELAEMAAGVK